MDEPRALIERLRAALAGRFDVRGHVGRGGAADVFEAHDVRHDRTVALKVLRPEVAAAVGVGRFLREIRDTARLSHPGILPLFDSGEADGLPYYVMPFAAGPTLRDRLREGGSLSPSVVVAITRDLADALDAAHAVGLVHRDVKPENIFIAKDRAILGDFGIAQAIDRATGDAMTQTGLALGTPGYMSPEQIGGTGGAGPASDQYALACVVFETISGRAPFTGPTPSDVLSQHLAAAPPDVCAERAGVPTAWGSILARALAKTPAARYSTCREFADALEATVAADSHHSNRVSWRRGLLVGGAAIVLLGALATGWWTSARRGAVESAPPSSPRIAVLPFAVHGGSSNADLGPGLAQMISVSLHGAAGLTTVDSRTLVVAWKRARIDPDDLDAARRFASKLNATHCVLGDVYLVGDSIRVESAIYRVNGGEALSRGRARGSLGQTFDLVPAIATQLLPAELSGVRAAVAIQGTQTTSSFEAARAFVEGEAHTDAEDLAAAIASYERAVAADSSFALAWARLGLTYSYAAQFMDARHATGKALALSARLQPAQRDVVRGIDAYVRGDPLEAERALYGALDRDRDQYEAWRLLSTVQTVFAPILGRTSQSVVPALRERVRLDPEDRAAISQMLDLAARRRDAKTCDSLLAVLDKKPGLTPWSGIAKRHLVAVFLEREPERRTLLATLDTCGVGAMNDRIDPYLRVYRPEIVDEALSRTSKQELDRGLLTLTLTRMAWVSCERGRWEETKSRVRRLPRFAPRAVPQTLGVLAAVGEVPLSASELDSVRAVVAADLPRSTETGAAELEVLQNRADGAWPVAQSYLLGLIDVRRGDFARAKRSESMLASYRGGPIDEQWARLYASSIAAHRLAAQGQTDEAVRLLERTTFRSEPGARLALRTLLAERMLLAKLYRKQGRLDEADRWLSTICDMFWFDFVLAAPAEFERGLLAESRQDWSGAATHYEHVVRLWKDADERFHPWRSEAEKALTRVRANLSRT